MRRWATLSVRRPSVSNRKHWLAGTIPKKSADRHVEYRFYPQNHSVARAGFKNPCIPYEDTGAGLVGFWSGFEPVAVVLSNASNPHLESRLDIY